MSNKNFSLSPKYAAFMRHTAPVEFLEGTTAAGKTTVALVKFVLACANSKKRLHILAAKDTGTAEKNLINKELGILDQFAPLVSYHGQGRQNEKIPHLLVHTNSGDKIIYVLGYGDSTKWKKALGGQYGCLYIDEINTASPDFVREAAMRCDYLLGTLNPDNPDLPIYSEYINRSRPLPEWRDTTPPEILADLETAQPMPGWVHWFFDFNDNPALTPEKLATIKANTPPGTKIYKNKILGLRGKATGLVFPNFTPEKNIIKKEDLQKQIKDKSIKIKKITIAVDTSYSQKSEDTIAIVAGIITEDRRFIVVDEAVYNNKDRSEPLAPSDTIIKINDFAARIKETYGFTRNIFIDAADAATITEGKKWQRLNGGIYQYLPSYKKPGIIDRIELMLGWISSGSYIVCDTCTEHIRELGTYSWIEDKDIPEDAHDHTINAAQYAFLPYTGAIGYSAPQKDNL